MFDSDRIWLLLKLQIFNTFTVNFVEKEKSKIHRFLIFIMFYHVYDGNDLLINKHSYLKSAIF